MRSLRHFVVTIGIHAALLTAGGNSFLSAQAADQQRSEVKPVLVKAIAGLSGISPNTDGSLILDPTTVRFAAEQGYVDIARRQIISVSTGEERIETGGTTGRVARALIPYGGGLALGAVTHKKVDLLTLEYLDPSGEYHGAVFLATSDDLSNIVEQLQAHSSSISVPAPSLPTRCKASTVQTDTVRVEVVDADLASAFPAEDRALLYENLVKRLQSEKTIAAVYRAGNHRSEAECAEFTVTVQAVAFTKGDQAIRASVGPLGHFVGTTKLRYHLTIKKQDGTIVLNREMKTSEGSDTDSLNITKAISKAVLKNLKKSRKQTRLNESA